MFESGRSADPDHVPRQRPRRPPRNARARGATVLRELAQDRMAGERREVQYNSMGQGVGEAATKLSTYIGLCVRAHIPVTYDKWTQVPEELKDKIWDSIEMSFQLDPTTKHAVLKSMSTTFRTFRYNLNKEYIKPFLEDHEVLRMPPAEYPFITDKQWDHFVDYRLTEEFKKISEEKKELQAKQQCPHHMARKGYAQLAHELNIDIKQNPAARTDLWKEGRKKKCHDLKGKSTQYVDETTIHVANEIDQLQRQNEGQDVLIDALGAPEHRERVRGVGRFVTPSFFFNMANLKSKKSQQGEKEYDQSQPLNSPCERSTRCASREDMIFNQDTVVEELVIRPDVPTALGTPCELVVEYGGSIVVVGTMYESSGPSDMVHGHLLGKHNVRVSVDMVFTGNTDLDLPMPVNEELQFLGQAVNSFVSWPRSLIGTPTTSKKAHSEPNIASNKKVASDSHSLQSANTISVPNMIRVLHSYAETQMSVGGIACIPIPRRLLGNEAASHYFLPQEDILEYCRMEEISYSSILCYICYLWESCDEETLDNFLFIDGSEFASGFCQKNQDARVGIIANRLDELASPNQRVFFSFNSGNHWILCVLVPAKKYVLRIELAR